MTFTFQLSFAEQYRASVAVSHRTPNERLEWIAFPLFGVLYLWLETLNLVTGRFPVSARSVALGVLCIAIMPGVAALQVWRVRRQNSLWAGPHAFTFRDDGIHITSPHIDVTPRWRDVTRFVETRSFLLFFVARRVAFYLPKRVMTRDQLRAVRDLTVARMASAKPRREDETNSKAPAM